MHSHQPDRKHGRRNNAILTAGALGLLVFLSGCSSSAKPAAQRTPSPSSPPAAVSSSPTAPTPTSSSAAPRADGYWFSVTESFVGGAQWKVAERLPQDPTDTIGLNGVGQVEFDGPDKATMVFDAPDNEGGTSAPLAQFMTTAIKSRQIVASAAPQPMTLGADGAPASYVSGHDSTGDRVILIISKNPSNQLYTDITLTCSAADLATDRAALQTLLHSFTFQH